MRRFLSTSKIFAVSALRSVSHFKNIEQGPPDPILGLGAAFKADTFPQKVNLAVGVYRDDNGKPFILDCVREAEDIVIKRNFDHEYAPIDGIPSFITNAQKIAFGKLASPRIATMQSLSGTGSLRVGAALCTAFQLGGKCVYLPDPSWGNHGPVFLHAGLTVKQYRYYDARTNSLDFSGMLEDIQKAPEGSIFLFQACAHNPTGIDPTKEQWKEIVDTVKQVGHLPFIDIAYQGFASGNLEDDAFSLRCFTEKCDSAIVAQSFAKSLGLYGQRVGAVHFVCKDEEEAVRVSSQAKILARPMYSNPPLHGARIVNEVVESEKLTKRWHEELHLMADRMTGIRHRLVEELKKCGSTKDWSHIINQIGMMAYTGLSKAQIERLLTEFHIYMTKDSRIAISGLNSKNVEYVAQCFHEVTKAV